jgi:hypothetical protein
MIPSSKVTNSLLVKPMIPSSKVTISTTSGTGTVYNSPVLVAQELSIILLY